MYAGNGQREVSTRMACALYLAPIAEALCLLKKLPLTPKLTAAVNELHAELKQVRLHRDLMA
jgi:hypothetical protein